MKLKEATGEQHLINGFFVNFVETQVTGLQYN